VERASVGPRGSEKRDTTIEVATFMDVSVNESTTLMENFLFYNGVRQSEHPATLLRDHPYLGACDQWSWEGTFGEHGATIVGENVSRVRI
jgi:hypothetical protein